MVNYRIKERRQQVNMTQEELAEQSGVSRTIISGLESGRITVTTTGTLVKIAGALKCDVSDIFFTREV